MNIVGESACCQARQPQARLQKALSCCLAIALGIGWASSGAAQQLTAVEAQSIAREAYVYGFPIVDSYKQMYAHAVDRDGEEFIAPFNTLKHYQLPFTPAETQVLTPNIDTPYSLLWMDLRTEPLVLGVPQVEEQRYYSIQLVDLFRYSFGYIGTRMSGNKPARYLIAGPDWKGEARAGIAQVIRCETAFAAAIYRTQLLGRDDLDNLHRLQSQFTVQALSELLGQPAPAPAAAIEFPRPASQPKPDLSFFSTLCFQRKFYPPHPSEQELMTRLARIGIVDGTFDAAAMPPEIQQALQQGIEEGDAAITAAVSKLTAAEVIGSREYLGTDYLKRAVAAKLGRFNNAKEEALNPLYLSDAKGKPLDGSGTKYLLKLGPNELPPVRGFWSVTMYDGETKRLVPNPLDRYQISSLTLSDLIRDADGGLTVHIQNEPPAEDETANWLPAPAGPFYLVMRLYWPKPEAYDGTWAPPLIWPEAPAPPTPTPAGTEAAAVVKPSALAQEPKPELERPTVWGEPTEVEIAIYVIDVDEVNSADQSFAASVYIEARWRNPLLRHQGPGPTHRGLTDVWNPRLTIIGQQMVWKSYPESVEIDPDGTVVYRQKLWGRFSQPLDLRNFPFDEQQLSIQLVAAGLRERDVKMVTLMDEGKERSKIAKTFSLPDFGVVSWSAEATPYYPGEETDGIAGYEMKIKVARQPTYYVLKIIIPLSLIIVMSWLPRWMDPEQSGTNIGISTSAFLTLVAYLFAVTTLLPRVSYVTRMDRFILLSTLTVFAGLIQTVTNTVLVKKRKGRAVMLDRWSRLIYPLLLALVLAYSFLL